MEELFDEGWIIPVLFIALVVVTVIVRAARAFWRSITIAVAEEALKNKTDLTPYQRLQAERLLQLKQGNRPQPNPAEQERRRKQKAEAKRRKQAENAQAKQTEQRDEQARTGRFTTQAQLIKGIEDAESVEAEGRAHAFEGGGAERDTESGERGAASVERGLALTANRTEGQSLLVDLDAEAMKDFADAAPAPKGDGLAQRLSRPQTLKDAVIAGEIFKRPEY
jgi:hypothetical protein